MSFSFVISLTYFLASSIVKVFPHTYLIYISNSFGYDIKFAFFMNSPNTLIFKNGYNIGNTLSINDLSLTLYELIVSNLTY